MASEPIDEMTDAEIVQAYERAVRDEDFFDAKRYFEEMERRHLDY